MKKITKNLFIFTLMLVHIFCVSAFAVDLEGDFSSRSLIMKTLNGEDRITQEQKDILKSKKLSPTTACLIEQIKKKNTENVKILLEAKVNPNTQFNVEYPIYTAAKTNNLEILELLYSYGAKPDKGFYSELYEAIKNKNDKMTWFLLDNGAKVNYKDAVTGKTPLYLALKNNMIDVAKELLEKGAKVDQKTYSLMRKKKLDYLLPK